jgi:hypothetical protein
MKYLLGLWFKPVIFSIWEADIRRIMIPEQPRQKVDETPISINGRSTNRNTAVQQSWA